MATGFHRCRHMDFSALLYSLGLSGFFSSRAFLPAFATSLALKYGDHLPWLKNLEFIQNAAQTPSWITNDWVVLTLGILAAAELLAEKSPELRELMEEGSVYAKTILSAATAFGLLSASDAEAATGIISMASVLDVVPAALTGGITFFLSSVRNGFVTTISEADDDDSLGVRGASSWIEELWAFFGVWLLLVAPLAVVVLLGLVFGGIWLLQKRYERKQEASKIACPNCQARIHAFATACFACGAPVAAPRKLGVLGGTLDETEASVDAQKVRLLELKRSPVSGDKVSGRGVDLVCPTDQVTLFADPRLTRRYIETVDARLLKVVVFSGLVSLIPVIGLIIGVVYYRFQLVAPYRRYLRFGKGIAMRWLVRLAFLLLILLQFVPVLGGLAVPLMALISHRFYRSAFVSSLGDAGLAPAARSA